MPEKNSIDLAEDKKIKGNEYFRQNNYRQALHCYLESIQLNSNECIYYANAAHSHLKLEEFEEALTFATRSIEKNPSYIKAYYLKAQALFFLRQFKNSLAACKKILELEPTHLPAQTKKTECEKKLRQLQFEEAIHVPELNLNQKYVDSINVSPKYEGPIVNSRNDMNEQFFGELMNFLKQKKSLASKYLLQILLYAYEIFSEQESLVDVNFLENSHMTVCGDIHGQYKDLLNVFSLFGFPSKTHYYLFNGDFVDRGPQSLEVMITLLSLKIIYPHSFFMARGNHESDHINRIYGFQKEVLGKYDEDIYTCFQKVFNALPLCHVIQKKIFTTHGGLPDTPKVSLDEIKKINRFCDPSDTNSLMTHLLWADPRSENGVGESARGTSITFGPDITKAFLDYNHLKCVIRSHEFQEEGYKLDHDGQCITVFSAPNYMSGKNKGAVVLISYDGSFKFEQFNSIDASST